nr:MAG TPA: portal protein [Caudoviricetes sp.]
MGLFEKIFKRPRPQGQPDGFFKTLTAYTPIFTSWGGRLYESELVRSAINARATHISKLSVQVQGAAKPRLQTKLRTGPNEWQTWGQFLYRLSTILDVQNTAFIVPVQDYFGEPTGIYPVLPSMCEIVQYNGEPWIRYQFSTGEFASVEMKYCGVMTKFQYSDDFFGDDNAALTPTMELINIQNQGISEGVKSAATFRFMARVNNFTKAEDLAKERERFTKENLQGEGGVLLFPNTYSDIQQIKSSPFVVDADQMNSIRQNVFDYFGVNEDVLQNKAYGDAWSAFYEGAIEPFAVQFSDVVTKMLFTERERASGSFLMATANRLQYMSNTDKINYATNMGDRGFIMIDEIREVFNLPPLPGNQGKRLPIRGEYYFLNDENGSNEEGEKQTNAGGNDREIDERPGVPVHDHVGGVK